MADLSSPARAVLDAFLGNPEYREELKDDRYYLATALRVAADVVDCDPWLQEHVDYRDKLFAIAAELENTSPCRQPDDQ